MHRHVVIVFVMLSVVVILVTTHCLVYVTAETTATKKLAQETGISVRQAERCLDANVFLDECLRWAPLRTHHPFIMHEMFAHVEVTGQREHDWAICLGWWQPSPKWDLGVESSTMDLISLGTPWDEISVIYNEVYQLQRLPRRSLCNGETEEQVCQEILDSIKECLWHRQGPMQLEGELKQSLAGTSKMDT